MGNLHRIFRSRTVVVAVLALTLALPLQALAKEDQTSQSGGLPDLAARVAALEAALNSLTTTIHAQVTSAQQTLASANAYTDSVFASLKQYIDQGLAAEASARATGDTNTLNSAKAYTDQSVSQTNAVEATARQAGDAATLASAESYTDTSVAAEAAARAAGDASTLSAAKAYTDTSAAAEASARATGDTNTLNAAKAYTDQQLAANAANDAANLAAAKAYTDQQLASLSTSSKPSLWKWGDTTSVAITSAFTPTTIGSLSLPAGTYFVFAKAVVTNSALLDATTYSSDRTVTCKLATDQGQADALGGPMGVTLNQMTVVTYAAPATLTWTCVSSPATKVTASQRELFAVAVSPQ